MKSITSFFNNLTMSKGILLALSPILTAIISMKSALLGLCILIILDLLTGIRKTHHEWEIKFNPRNILFWKCIKSYLLRQTWKKTYEYGIGILVIITFETLVFGTSNVIVADKEFTLAELAILVPAVVEVWSIFENFEAVSGNNILKKLKYLLPASLQKLFNKTNEESTNS